MIINEDAYLEHFGVKGMRWGHRKQQDRTPMSRKKKAAIILGSAAAAAAIAAGAYFLHKKLGTSVKSSPEGEKFVKAMVKEPVSIIHGARGKSVGWSFPGRGGVEDPLKEYEKAGFHTNEAHDFFKRYGERNEKVAARFVDPKSRKDQHGRGIVHEVILPESLSDGVNNHAQAVSKAWPLIKDVYEAFYEGRNR